MTPDYERAAIKAAETLIKFGIVSAPVSPIPILKKMPGVFLVSYEAMANDMGTDRRSMISIFSEKNQDAFTSVRRIGDKTQYLITYNQRLPLFLVQRALSRELGHIVLGHDGSRPEEVRNAEAICFANHLLCPRALINTLMQTGIKITKEVLGNLTGCYDHCLACMRLMPCVNVPAELNRQIRDNFMPYIMNFFEFQRYASINDGSEQVFFGTYMDGYKE